MIHFGKQFLFTAAFCVAAWPTLARAQSASVESESRPASSHTAEQPDQGGAGMPAQEPQGASENKPASPAAEAQIATEPRTDKATGRPTTRRQKKKRWQDQQTVQVQQPPIPPQDWHIRLNAGTTPIKMLSPSYDAVGWHDNFIAADIGVEGEYQVLSQIALTLQLQYQIGGFGGELMETVTTSVLVHSAQLGVTAGYRFWDSIAPYLRLGVSANWANYRAVASGPLLDRWAFSPGGLVMLGTELSLPRKWVARYINTQLFTAGLRLEGGYHQLGLFEYGEQKVEGKSDKDKTLYYTPPLGTLDLGGIGFRLGLVLSF